jgi:hypothetical protein
VGSTYFATDHTYHWVTHEHHFGRRLGYREPIIIYLTACDACNAIPRTVCGTTFNWCAPKLTFNIHDGFFIVMARGSFVELARPQGLLQAETASEQVVSLDLPSSPNCLDIVSGEFGACLSFMLWVI